MPPCRKCGNHLYRFCNDVFHRSALLLLSQRFCTRDICGSSWMQDQALWSSINLLTLCNSSPSANARMGNKASTTVNAATVKAIYISFPMSCVVRLYILGLRDDHHCTASLFVATPTYSRYLLLRQSAAYRDEAPEYVC